ncbi:MAG TPA: DUF4870 domain-containing protein [Steroidobacteraceae bacterium]|nr:DUF4870 domain-containing protein [Steroidobacteraceae bacterium]
MSEPGAAPAPGAAPSDNERTWGMLAHLAAFAGLVLPLVGNVVVPLLIWHSWRERSKFVGEQALESLNFNLSVSIGALICWVLVVVFVGFLLGTALFIAWLALTLIAAIKASEGVNYRYPFALRLVK